MAGTDDATGAAVVYSTDLFEFCCTVLFLHTTLKGCSVHTYLPTANRSADL